MIPSKMQRDLYAVIMAGGSGTRFWPRSRAHRPKQLLNITGDAGGGLLNRTIERIKPIIPISRIKIVTTLSQADAVKSAVPELSDNNIIAEPMGKNTAPAIGISALFVEQENADAVMVILPADHYIEHDEEFRKRIMAGAHQAAQEDSIVTIGVTPRRPETGYGYIEAGDIRDRENAVYNVRSFQEKPTLVAAKEFIDKGNFFWNSGIFIVKVSLMFKEIGECLPHNYQLLMTMRQSLGTDRETSVIKEAYRKMEAVSIDYGVIEKTKRVLMVEGDFGWNDVGSWPSAAEYWPMDNDNNAFRGEVVQLDSSNCIVHSPKKLVALLGVEDLVVVEEDDALLICKREKSQDVKKLVEILKSQGKDALL